MKHTPLEKHEACLRYAAMGKDSSLASAASIAGISKGTMSKWHIRWSTRGKSPEAFSVRLGRPPGRRKSGETARKKAAPKRSLSARVAALEERVEKLESMSIG